jgi:hypothetical protein
MKVIVVDERNGIVKTQSIHHTTVPDNRDRETDTSSLVCQWHFIDTLVGDAQTVYSTVTKAHLRLQDELSRSDVRPLRDDVRIDIVVEDGASQASLYITSHQLDHSTAVILPVGSVLFREPPLIVVKDNEIRTFQASMVRLMTLAHSRE